MSSDTLVIYPYLLRDTWVFDDARTGLKEEAFVMGASEMISRLVSTKRIPRTEKGFAMTFSDKPFEGHDVVLSLLRPDEYEGNWYHGYVTGLRMECWLCPALFCYFASAPDKIYVRADPLPVGVNPIWEPPDDAEPRRFVEPPQATTPIDPTQQKELQDFRASLPDELKAVLDSMIKAKGEEYVHSILGHLKDSLEEAINL